MKKYVLLNIIYGIVLFLFIVTLSISIPIFCRFIHTLCIEPFHMVEELNSCSGQNYTFDDVVEAYNQVLDYCVFYKKFGAGKLLYQEEDIVHFEDCRKLFTINFCTMIVSFITILLFKIIEKKKRVIMFKPAMYLTTGILAIAFPIAIGALCAINFEAAFYIFHKIFFFNKANYGFDPYYNHVILILPSEFFMVCGIVIGVSIFIGAIILIFILL